MPGFVISGTNGAVALNSRLIKERNEFHTSNQAMEEHQG